MIFHCLIHSFRVKGLAEENRDIKIKLSDCERETKLVKLKTRLVIEENIKHANLIATQCYQSVQEKAFLVSLPYEIFVLNLSDYGQS